MSEGYVITDRPQGGKRIRIIETGELTPFFYTPDEALQFIRKRLGNSPYCYIHKTRDDKNARN